MEKRRDVELFQDAPLFKAFITLAVPTVITQIIMIIYNFADTYFVGMTNNENAVAALTVSMPVFIIMAALSNLFGVGGSSVIARLLGMNKPEKAKKAFAVATYGGIFVALLYSIIIFFSSNALIPLIGGDEFSFPYIKEYMFWTMVIGAVPSIMNNLFGHLVRSIGDSKQASIGMSFGAILNIILDPIFMFLILPSGKEVMGAAIATLISNIAACIYFIIYIIRHYNNGIFTLNIKHFTFKDKIFSNIVTIGIPAALSTTLAMVSNIFANKLLISESNQAISGIGIAKKVNALAFNINMGMTQGMLPLIAYNYASKNYDRMKKAVILMLSITLGFSTICLILYEVFAPFWIRIFMKDEAVVNFGVKFLRIIAIAVPFCGISYSLNTVFQATKKRVSSFLLSILRKGLFDIPLMFILKNAIGYMGVLWATPIAEVAGIIVAIVLFVIFLKSLKKEETLEEAL